MVLAGNKAKHLSSVNHTTKTIHYHHHNHHLSNKVSFVLRKISRRGLVSNLVPSAVFRSKIQPWEQDYRELRTILKSTLCSSVGDQPELGKFLRKLTAGLLLNHETKRGYRWCVYGKGLQARQLLIFIGENITNLLRDFQFNIQGVLRAHRRWFPRTLYLNPNSSVYTPLDSLSQRFIIFAISKFFIN